ncbi:MAG: hypothetical protein HZA28_04250 [Candidatus Omnitrophica bacterium]|nr:hypothetical protein [Candidatus Omnitrophota bacterium]
MLIQIKKVEARQFRRVLKSGRTTPLLFECEDVATGQKEEYVVKLKGSLDRRDRGLICELVSSTIARFMGFNTPPIAVVNIDAQMASLIDAIPKDKIDSSIGLNFGSKLLSGGYFNLPNDYPLTNHMEQAAAEIIIFDALIQNFDRRAGKPNMFIKGDEIYIFDHELAFSFLELIGKRDSPWEQAAFSSCVRGHFFYRQLKGRTLSLERITQGIKNMGDDFLLDVQASIPEEWKDGEIGHIFDHLKAIVENADRFIEGVRREMV